MESCADFNFCLHYKRALYRILCVSSRKKFDNNKTSEKGETYTPENMLFAKRSVSSMVMVLMTVCILLTVTHITEAGYRKPPFNGSIFGKRSGNSIGIVCILLPLYRFYFRKASENRLFHLFVCSPIFLSFFFFFWFQSHFSIYAANRLRCEWQSFISIVRACA